MDATFHHHRLGKSLLPSGGRIFEFDPKIGLKAIRIADNDRHLLCPYPTIAQLYESNIELGIEYDSHNIDTSQQFAALLFLFNKWAEYVEMEWQDARK